MKVIIAPEVADLSTRGLLLSAALSVPGLVSRRTSIDGVSPVPREIFAGTVTRESESIGSSKARQILEFS